MKSKEVSRQYYLSVFLFIRFTYFLYWMFQYFKSKDSHAEEHSIKSALNQIHLMNDLYDNLWEE